MISSLKKILPKDRIKEKELMKNHTTFKTGGPCRVMVFPETAEEIKAVINELKANSFPFTVIGNGSNLLIRDEGIDTAVIKLSANFSEIEVYGNVIKANSGVSMVKIAVTALNSSLKGFENLSGIPGTLGGAVYMNAGAYGSEIKDILKEVTYIDENLDIITKPANELDMEYRSTYFSKNGGIILSAVMEFEKGNREEIKALMEETAKKRMDKQPLEFPSAGSTFKRPEGHFAGKLIEDAGLKGFSVGGAQISEKHAGFVINTGNATSSDILELMKKVTEKVYSLYGVTLEPEVKII